MRRTLALTLLATSSLALAACSYERGDDRLGSARDALKVCPGPVTVEGVDVSKYQGTVNWTEVAGAGVEFAIARINDGTVDDAYFPANWSGMKSAGLVRGAYQFWEPGDAVDYQANKVIAAVGKLEDGDLPVALDLEKTTVAPTIGPIQQWIDLVTEGTGKRPMIYTGYGYWNQYFNGQLADLDLWVANYQVTCPTTPNSWSNWIIWQPGTKTYPGITGAADHDIFNGSSDDLHALASADTTQACAASKAVECGKTACHCADDQCSGGSGCDGSGCSAKHTTECQAMGCGCVDGDCSGGSCPGNGCTAKQTADCDAKSMDCSLGACVATVSDAGADGGGGSSKSSGDEGGCSIGAGAGTNESTGLLSSLGALAAVVGLARGRRRAFRAS